MTEVKNTYADLIPREIMGSQKAGAKTSAEEVSGFKNMIRNKSEKDGKKDAAAGKMPDKKEAKASDEAKGDALELALAAVSVTAPVTVPVMQEKQMADSFLDSAMEAAGPESVSAVSANPFQAMEQLRFQALTGQTEKGPGILEETAGDAVLKGPGIGPAPQAPEKELKQKENTLKAGEEKNVLADMPVRPAHRTAREVSGNLKEDTAVKRQNVLLPKEEKNREKEAVTLQAAASEAISPKSHVRAAEKSSGGEETAAATLKADSQEDLEAKLSEQLMKQIAGGKKELDIQLEPHNLGKIRIKISYEDSRTSVSVLCSESSTLKLLSKSAGELGSILESNLERPVEVFVDKQEADYLNSQQERQSEGRQQQRQQQHQESHKDSGPEDFIQKLRLGISGTGIREEAAGYR